MAVADDCALAVRGLTVPLLLHRNATEFGTRPALTTVDGPAPATMTWAELHDEVAAVTCGLDALGLRPGERMLIAMPARPEHWVVELAAVHLGAVPCTVYPTLSPDQLRHLGRHSAASVLVLAGAEELARWRPVLDDLPNLRAVLVLEGNETENETENETGNAVPDGDPRCHRLSDVVAKGRAAYAADRGAFTDRWQAVSPEQPVALLYTSGTTGEPKGVVLSHHNVLYQAAALEATMPTPPHAPSVSYRSLAHVTERVLGIYLPLFRAGHVHLCADPGRVVAAMCRVRPVSFAAVPRVWAKLVAALQAIATLLPEDQRAEFQHAHALTLDAYLSRALGMAVDADLAAEVAELDRSALWPVRAMLGLDEVVWPGSGAAPIPVDILYYLAGVGIEVLEGWGLTETTGTATTNTPARFRPGTVGLPHTGMRVKLAADGEILVAGPLVCLGYLQQDGTVAAQVDADGWLATGDLGALDADGFLTVTGRKKELIVTEDGKTVSPARIEGMLRTHPLVGHAVAIGDRRPYVTALIALDEEAARAWARTRGIGTADLTALARHPVVLAELDRVVATVNERLATTEQVRRYRVLERPWTARGGELTPTLTPRRRVIAERCAAVVDDLYRVEVTNA